MADGQARPWHGEGGCAAGWVYPCRGGTSLAIANGGCTPGEDQEGVGVKAGIAGRWRDLSQLQGKGSRHVCDDNLGGTRLFSIIFILCNWCDQEGTHQLPEWVGRGDVKAVTGDRCSTFPSAKQMLSDKQRRGRAAVKWRRVWSWHWCPWAGTEEMDKEAFGGTLHSLTAANRFQHDHWNPVLEMFWVRAERLFQLC